MEDAFVDAQKGGHHSQDASVRSTNNVVSSGDSEFDFSESRSKRLVRRVDSHNNLISKVKQLQRSTSYIKESFYRSISILDSWIPKHIVTVDEKRLRRCLKFVRVSASKAAPYDVPLNLKWEEIGVLCDSFGPDKIGSEGTCDFARFNFDSPSACPDGSLVINPSGHWIVGSVMGTKSMVNILNSRLFRKIGAFDGDNNFEKASFGNESICYDLMNSPIVLSNCSSNKLCRETPSRTKQKCKSEAAYDRHVSVSSTNSTCSDRSSSLFSSMFTQGMLQCTWGNGNPCFVFSVDDQNVVYVANLWKVDSVDNKAVEFVYVFHSSRTSQKEKDASESRIVGKMMVSTSFNLCSKNFRVMEREFVLFDNNEMFGRMQSSNDIKKKKGLKKVAEAFRNSHSFKKKPVSKLGGSDAILENCSCKPFQDADNSTDAHGKTNFLDSHPPPNLESVAIVVKEHIPEKCQERTGGWGLKFLKKSIAKVSSDPKESSQPSSCDRNSSECSTSMDIIIPAGIHGGPRTRNGGPSSLIERWRSGGCCDCGGWDLGCPLTVLKSRLSNNELSPHDEMQGECKLVDLVTQGSENRAPPLRMVNIHNGLYFVHFQSSLSALQSFSIAVAFIHTQSPSLRPENIQP